MLWFLNLLDDNIEFFGCFIDNVVFLVLSFRETNRASVYFKFCFSKYSDGIFLDIIM